MMSVQQGEVSRAVFGSDRGSESFAVKTESPSLSLVTFENPDSHEGL